MKITKNMKYWARAFNFSLLFFSLLFSFSAHSTTAQDKKKTDKVIAKAKTKGKKEKIKETKVAKETVKTVPTSDPTWPSSKKEPCATDAPKKEFVPVQPKPVSLAPESNTGCKLD